MRTVGIIAEYNPFHTGHAYHIRKARELSGADYAIVVMSPDFVQRGEPAVFDKFTRTRMALLNGADLVIELPVCFASGSAEYFAEGAVSMLDRLGAVDVLCFGAESADPGMFQAAAGLLSDEPAEYAASLRELLRQGRTWPQARAEALRSRPDPASRPGLSDDQPVPSCPVSHPDPASRSGLSDDQLVPSCPVSRPVPAFLHDPSSQAADTDGLIRQDLADFLSSPNNILGTEYCRAIRKHGSSMSVIPLQREGSSYNSTGLEGSFCSASALRQSIQHRARPEQALSYIPENCRELFLDACDTVVTSEELLPFLVQKLLTDCSYSSVLDVSSDLSNRIRSMRYACIGRSYEETVAALRTKQLTEARIRRSLLHLILGIQTADMDSFRAGGCVYYARALGFRRDAAALLHEIKKKASVPFLTKPAHARTLPEGPARQMWKLDLYASHLYRSILSCRTHSAFATEYELSPVIL